MASYDAIASLESFGPVSITNAAPEYAKALLTEIESSGGAGRIIDEPEGTGTLILTEGLSQIAPAERHYRALKAVLAVRTGVKTILLSRTSSPVLAEIGGAAGLVRSLRQERPDAEAYSISIAQDTNPGSVASKVIQALSLPNGDYSVQRNGIYQDVLGEDHLSPAPPEQQSDFKPIWLVSGGGRGVTADCTAELARRTGGTFILLGRSDVTPWPEWLPLERDLKTLRGLLARNSGQPGMPRKPMEIDKYARRLLASLEISNTIASIEQAGAKARYIQADIGDANQLRTALQDIQNEQGRITGLVHGAGVLADGTAESLRPEDFQRVFGPKVSGLENILASLDVNSLSHIALFSSASAVFGNEGQANYAAANEWLNNVALQLAGELPATQVKAFCWGPWQGGMVDEALARMFTERGIGLIGKAEGARIFADQLLQSPHDQIRFVVGDDWGE
ncbi:SDR family NAD(P)-dependent oxidoreductase [Hyphomonas sp.]|uniref:SDR family NAD(P)-dependent oxidoreductase n=1 Tax=Hyphomonas sp. TaxID=87 RepID=UPI003242A204